MLASKPNGPRSKNHSNIRALEGCTTPRVASSVATSRQTASVGPYELPKYAVAVSPCALHCVKCRPADDGSIAARRARSPCNWRDAGIAWPFAAGAAIFGFYAWRLYDVEGAERSFVRAAAATVAKKTLRRQRRKSDL